MYLVPSFWGRGMPVEGLWGLAAASRRGSHCLPWCAALGLATPLRAAATVHGGHMAEGYRQSTACLGRAGGVAAASGHAWMGVWGVLSCGTLSQLDCGGAAMGRMDSRRPCVDGGGAGDLSPRDTRYPGRRLVWHARGGWQPRAGCGGLLYEGVSSWGRVIDPCFAAWLIVCVVSCMLVPFLLWMGWFRAAFPCAESSGPSTGTRGGSLPSKSWRRRASSRAKSTPRSAKKYVGAIRCMRLTFSFWRAFGCFRPLCLFTD